MQPKTLVVRMEGLGPHIPPSAEMGVYRGGLRPQTVSIAIRRLLLGFNCFHFI